jgi:phage shock protein A
MARLFRANIYNRLNRNENPEQSIDQLVTETQEHLIQLRQAFGVMISTQKCSEQQYNKAIEEAESWREKANLASMKGDEEPYLASQIRVTEYADIAEEIKKNIVSNAGKIEALKTSLIQLEAETSGMKTKRDQLKSRATAAQSQEQWHKTIIQINQLLTDYEREIDQSEASELYWVQTSSRIQIDSEQLHQTLAGAFTEEELLRQQYEQAVQNEFNWQQKAEIASSNGNQALLTKALEQKKKQAEIAAIKQSQIDTKVLTTVLLKHYLISLRSQANECQSHLDRQNQSTQTAELLQRLQKLQDDVEHLATISNSTATDQIQQLQAVQSEYWQLHQILAAMIISQNIIEKQCNQTIQEESFLQQQSQSAFSENDFISGIEALSNKIRYAKMVTVLQKRFDSQAKTILLLENSLREIERQIHHT